MPWLRLVLQPEAAEGAPDSAALQHWHALGFGFGFGFGLGLGLGLDPNPNPNPVTRHARLRFATMQSLASLRIGEGQG